METRFVMKKNSKHSLITVVVSILGLVFLTGCFCWPSLPSLIHRGSCAAPQYAADAKSKQAVPLPPKTFIAYAHEGDIWIMDSEGKNKKGLTWDFAREFSISAAFQTERIWFIRETGSLYEKLAYGDVYSCDYDGKNVKQVTSGLRVIFAEVSPSGKTLAISVLFGETSDMWLVDATGDKLTEESKHEDLTADIGALEIGGREGSAFAAWSPQEDKLAITFKPDTNASLGISTKTVYLVNADGTGRTALIQGADQPTFNNNGTMVAVTNGAHWDTMGVAQVGVGGGTPTEILPIASESPQYSTYNPVFITTYEDIKEWPTVVYGKTTHPTAPAQPVNTLEKYRIEGGVRTVLVEKEGAENVISNITTDGSYDSIFFQTGKTATSNSNNATIWSVKPDGKDLKMLSDIEGDDDSEPTVAVSYTWNYKNKKGGETTFTGCHWPYAD